MADITMCRNEFCPKRERCHRAIADIDPYWQSWARFDPELDDCFWEINE